jgi:hypothetical protein
MAFQLPPEIPGIGHIGKGDFTPEFAQSLSVNYNPFSLF